MKLICKKEKSKPPITPSITPYFLNHTLFPRWHGTILLFEYNVVPKITTKILINIPTSIKLLLVTNYKKIKKKREERRRRRRRKKKKEEERRKKLKK